MFRKYTDTVKYIVTENAAAIDYRRDIWASVNDWQVQLLTFNCLFGPVVAVIAPAAKYRIIEELCEVVRNVVQVYHWIIV